MKGRAFSQFGSKTAFSCGFTLVELLVVISVIAVLMAILVPILGRVREVGQRAVCLSNLRQLTTAWLLYADDHDGNLVSGLGYPTTIDGKHIAQGWVNWEPFYFPESLSAILDDPDKGALWSYMQDVGIYHCPRASNSQGWAFLGNSYAILGGANGPDVEGVFQPCTATQYRPNQLGVRVGKTVLKLTNLKEIVSPGAAQRGVFIDIGGPTNGSFDVDYLLPRYRQKLPNRHVLGTTISMADGHGKYWKWKGQETLGIMTSKEGFDHGYWPETEDGLFDLQRMQKTMWGRLGYNESLASLRCEALRFGFKFSVLSFKLLARFAGLV